MKLRRGRARSLNVLLVVAVVAGGLAAGTFAVQPAHAAPPPGIVAAGAPLTISQQEAVPISGTVANFTDSEAARTPADFTATIQWGDGSTTAGTVNGSGGNYSVSGSHAYSEDGTFTGLVTLRENSSGNAAIAHFTANITEGAFGVNPGPPINLSEGTPFSGTVATFTDPGSDDAPVDFTALVNWGDGTSSRGMITGSSGNYAVTGSHVYEDEGTYSYLVTVSEPETGFTSGAVGANATISDADVLSATGTTFTPVPGVSFTGTVATAKSTYTANTADFVAAIDWGDGTQSPGTVLGDGGNLFVVGTHTYAASATGDKVVGVAIADDPPGTASASTTSTAHLQSQAGVRRGPPLTIAPQEGIVFSGTVANFSDSDTTTPAGAFTATIDWGDGTISAGTVNGSNGAFSVTGTHAYNEDGPHTGLVTLTENAPSVSRAIGNFVVNVAEGSFGVSASPFAQPEGAVFSGTVATLQDPGSTDPATDFVATIDWGDGTSDTGFVSGSNGNYTVTGSHRYTDEGTFTYLVTVAEPEAHYVIGPFGAVVTITESDVLSGTGTVFTPVPGVPYTGIVGTATDTYPNNDAADFTATIDWGDGTTTPGTVGGNGRNLYVTGTHTYAPNALGYVPVHVTLSDDAPGSASTSMASTAFLQPQADLSITKTDNKTKAAPGTTDTYTIVVGNAGPSAVSGATVTDAFPASFTNVQYTATATGGATGFTASGAGDINDTVTMPSGSTIRYTATGTISPSATGSLSNTATVKAPAGYSDPSANNSQTDTDTLTPRADVSITKTDNATTATPGSAVTYTIVVSNAGPSNVSGVAVKDTFPAALTNVHYTSASSGGASGNTASGTGNIADTVALPSGSSITYTATGTVSPTATGTLTNTAKVTPPSGTDPNAANNTATDSDTLTPQTDLSITKTDNKTKAVPGTSDTYTIVVHNAGPSTAVGAKITDTFPAAFGDVHYTATQTGGATGFTASGAGNISDTVTMPPNSTITYVATGTISPSALGTLTNTANVSAGSGAVDPVTGNNSATDSDTLTPRADLVVSKTGPSTAVPGSSATYTIGVHNNGPSDAQQVVVSDPTPPGTTFVSIVQTSGPAATCSTPAPGAAGTVNCTIPTLPAGATATFKLTLHVNPGTSGTVAETAHVSSNTTDPSTGNNSATVNTVARCDHTVTGTHYGNLSLSGGSWCIAGATVWGSIAATSGTTLVITDSTVHGNLNAQAPKAVTVCSSDTGSVSISEATGFVLLGDPGDDNCGGNTFRSSVSLNYNHAGVEVGHNTIHGSLVLNANTGRGPFPEDARPEVEANTIFVNLSCWGDNPPATNDGQPNTVYGSRSGECGSSGF